MTERRVVHVFEFLVAAALCYGLGVLLVHAAQLRAALDAALGR